MIHFQFCYEQWPPHFFELLKMEKIGRQDSYGLFNLFLTLLRPPSFSTCPPPPPQLREGLRALRGAAAAARRQGGAQGRERLGRNAHGVPGEAMTKLCVCRCSVCVDVLMCVSPGRAHGVPGERNDEKLLVNDKGNNS
jgi:hypothetical protein